MNILDEIGPLSLDQRKFVLQLLEWIEKYDPTKEEFLRLWAQLLESPIVKKEVTP